jgi:hypothetical protein
VYFYIEVNLRNLLFANFFLAGFANQGVLNMHPTVWLDGARPANTCIPPSYSGSHPRTHVAYPTPKIHLQAKKLEKFGEITFF